MGGCRAGPPNSRVFFPTSVAVTSLLQQPQAPAQRLGSGSCPGRAVGRDGAPGSKPSTLGKQPEHRGIPTGHPLPAPTHALGCVLSPKNLMALAENKPCFPRAMRCLQPQLSGNAAIWRRRAFTRSQVPGGRESPV